MKLNGRGAIITGANQGLGRAIATSYVRAGASVLLVARGEELLREVQAELEPLASQPGQTVAVFAADVSDPDRCAAIAGRAQTALRSFDSLVNNAGVLGPLGLVEEVDWDKWVETIRINLFGTVLMCRAVIPLLRRQGYGKIINVSGGGATGPRPRFSAYAASKAAVVRFTETLAEEVKDFRIDVNAIAPGALKTRMFDEILAAGPEKVGAEAYASALRQHADSASPENAAELAVFLASSASDGITGRLLSAVWDDWAALERRREELAKTDIYTLRRIVPQDRKLTWSCE